MLGPVTYTELKHYIRKDLGYVNGKLVSSFITRYFLEAGFKYTVWLRLTRYFYLKRNYPAFILCRMVYKHYGYKYSFDVSYRAQIGGGLTIAHYGYIVVMSNAILGENVTLRPGVVFGKKLTEDVSGAKIGNNVDFGVGSKIIGAITIGDNVTVGANAVVTKDIPDNAVVAKCPAEILRIKSDTK